MSDIRCEIGFRYEIGDMRYVTGGKVSQMEFPIEHLFAYSLCYVRRTNPPI